MGSEKFRTAVPRIWKCKNCGFVNQINLRRKIIHATYICGSCREQVYIYDVEGESQYLKGQGVLLPVNSRKGKS